MNKTELKHKNATVSNNRSKTYKKRKTIRSVVNEGFINSMAMRRIDELSLPPMRTLIENKKIFKHILTDRAAQSIESIEGKLKLPASNRYGEDEGSNAVVTISHFSEPKYKRQTAVDKVARAKYLLNVSKSKKSRLEILSAPLKRRLPEPVSDNPIVCNVKPSTLRYVASERTLELAKPKTIRQKLPKKKRKKRSHSRFTRWKR